MKSMQFAALVALVVFSQFARADVWPTTNAWSPAMEQTYQDWVRTSWIKDIFDEPGPLKGIKLDCADAVYSMRLLFSYEQRLPYAVKDPSSAHIISNEMKRFDAIADQDQRFRQFAIFLYNVVGTGTLAEDSYPLAMDRSAIHAGVFLKSDHATHHSWTVRDVDRAGVPFLLFASRPARTTLLDRHYYPTMGFLWGKQDAAGNQVDSDLQTPGDPASAVGFRMFRYPADLRKPEWQVPGYSAQQYQMPMIRWSHTLQTSLQLSRETSEQLVSRLVGEACKEATDRISVVREASRRMLVAPSQCFSASDYDDLSTPSKDSRSRGVFNDLIRAYNDHSGELSAATRERAARIVENRDDNSYCRVNVTSDHFLTLGTVMHLANKWSSNPNDSLEARWGLVSWPTPHAAGCPTY